METAMMPLCLFSSVCLKRRTASFYINLFFNDEIEKLLMHYRIKTNNRCGAPGAQIKNPLRSYLICKGLTDLKLTL